MSVHYRTTMHLTGRNTGIPVPSDVLDTLGGGRPAVVVEVNGYRFVSTVGSMGGLALIPFSAQRRAESGLAGGDALTVSLELDTTTRETTVPPDLADALGAAGVRAAFDGLAPSRRAAQVAAVEAARSAETRTRRVLAAVEGLRP